MVLIAFLAGLAADFSSARADAEQQITTSERAVETASNRARADVDVMPVDTQVLVALGGASKGAGPAGAQGPLAIDPSAFG